MGLGVFGSDTVWHWCTTCISSEGKCCFCLRGQLWMVLSQLSPQGKIGATQTQKVTHYFENEKRKRWKKKHKEESIGPNQYIHFLLVMESVCNSSLNTIDLQSSCFSFLSLLPSLFFLFTFLPMLLHPKGQRVHADLDTNLCKLHIEVQYLILIKM